MRRFHPRLWWVLLAATVAGLVALGIRAKTRAARRPAEGVPAALRIGGQYAVGVRDVAQGVARQAVERLAREAERPADEVRAVVLVGEVAGAEAARARIAALLRRGVRGAARGDLEVLDRLYGGGTVDEEARRRLVARHGWFGELALTQGLDEADPARRAVLGPAKRVARTLLAATIGALLLLAAGIVLLLVAVLAFRQGRLAPAFAPPPARPEDTLWLECVVLLLAAVLAISIAPRFFPNAGAVGDRLPWALLLVPLWPLARGASVAEWRAGLGLGRGRGFLREAGAGLLGYVAGLPIVFLGVLATTLLAGWLDDDVSHPVAEELLEGRAWLEPLLMAAVLAPLVEESVFRGAFYRYLRPRLAALPAATVVGVVFAAVHPQGLAALPALAAIGLVLAAIREWRGSLVGSLTAHAAHNLALLTLVVRCQARLFEGLS